MGARAVPARKELTRFEGAKVRAKQRLRGLKRLWRNGGGWTTHGGAAAQYLSLSSEIQLQKQQKIDKHLR
eukprot:SM000020S05996  [mRNA]  locus=s20:312415:315977:+ [translate_table: standard]